MRFHPARMLPFSGLCYRTAKGLRPKESVQGKMNQRASKNWVQAPPACAFLLFLSQRLGAPDPEG
jgi:hypothetical protein